jgi:hypothetical protein
MAILLFGFGLVAHGRGNWFSPPADSLEQAIFIAGSALATMGLSGIEAHGPARRVLVAAGICGLAVLTLFIVAIPDHDTAACALLSKARLLEEKVETVGEADQALLDQYLIKTGSVFCVLDWS